VKTKVIFRVVAAFIMRSRYVSPAHSSARKERQGSTVIGASWRIAGSAAGWCSGPLLYLGRSTIRRNWLRKSNPILEEGARQPRHAVAVSGGTAGEGFAADASIVRLRLNELGCAGRASGADAWLARACGASLSSIVSGRTAAAEPQGHAGGTGAVARWRPTPAGAGSEWRCIANWFERSAMRRARRDLGLAESTSLRCHDRLLEHKQALFDHLVGALARTCSTISFECCSTI